MHIPERIQPESSVVKYMKKAPDHKVKLACVLCFAHGWAAIVCLIVYETYASSKSSFLRAPQSPRCSKPFNAPVPSLWQS